MKMIVISKEQSKTFAVAFPIEEIKAFVAANKIDFLRWCAEEAVKETQNTPTPKKQRNSRKKIVEIGGVNYEC